jgi:hypothetical protein
MRSIPVTLLLAALSIGQASFAQEAPPKPSAEYRSVHGEVPAWLEARFEKTIEFVKAGNRAPTASPEEVRAFLKETFEHINEVNALVEKIGGKARPLPKDLGSAAELKGVHDFGEYASTRRVREFLEGARKTPLVDFRTREAVPVPQWLETLVTNAEAKGQRTIDVGKLAPWVAAGLARNGAADIYSIKLHNLSGHHADFSKYSKVSHSLIEAIADRVNAMRQVRIYRAEPMPFETIRRFLLEDVSRGSLPKVAEGVIKDALKAQRALERSGRVNPYFMKEAGHKYPRLSDGSIDWKKFSANQVKKQGAGLAHFTLALFLKELAVVVKTGDRLRIEEFFEGLASTDFFVDYGLFAAGAQTSQVVYQKYLARHIKPRFVASVLQTNLVLAAGLALPELARGRFNGKTFAIDVAGLGLSSATVKLGLEALARVWKLERFRMTGQVMTKLQSLRRFAKAGAWVYTAVETAVVLYFGEQISSSIHKYLDDKAAREALGKATQDFFGALREKTKGELGEALAVYEKAHSDYRNHLYKPLHAAEQQYYARLNKVAREAKLEADKRQQLQQKLDSLPRIKQRLIARHGSADAYFKKQKAKADVEIDRRVREIMEIYQQSRGALLDKIYNGPRRKEGYLKETAIEWQARGASAGAAGDPYGGRNDFFARLGRSQDFVAKGAEKISGNRLQAYDDMLASLALASKSHPKHKEVLDIAAAELEELKELDKKLIGVESKGATKALGGALKKR